MSKDGIKLKQARNLFNSLTRNFYGADSVFMVLTEYIKHQ